jgi:hypothetical protein
MLGHNPLASEGAWAFLGDVSAYPLSHFILPFTMHLFFENFWMVLCCCYLYESFEAYLDAEFVEKGKAAPGPLGWEGVPEPKLDSLVGDPIMGILGLATAKMLRIWFTSKDYQCLFPSDTGSFLRRAALFFCFSAPSFFFLNWDPVLKNREDGWTEEDPLPPWGFRLGDMIFALNYILMIRATFGLQSGSNCPKLYIAWASISGFFFLGIIFLGKPLGGTTYIRLLVQWLVLAAVFLVCWSYRTLTQVDDEKPERNCGLFSLMCRLQNHEDKEKQKPGDKIGHDCDLEISEKAVLADSAQV